jgi:hypothetical protein
VTAGRTIARSTWRPCLFSPDIRILLRNQSPRFVSKDRAQREEATTMTMATLQKLVRDPRSGEVHLPNERVEILGVMRNLEPCSE